MAVPRIIENQRFSVQLTVDRKQLLRWPKRDPQLQRALENLGTIAVGEAKRLAPVETGHLRRNVRFRISRSALRSGAVREVAPGAMVMEMGAENVPYAIYQEVGTIHNPPHPFLRPALIIALNHFKLAARASASSAGLHRSLSIYYRDRAILGRPIYSAYQVPGSSTWERRRDWSTQNS